MKGKYLLMGAMACLGSMGFSYQMPSTSGNTVITKASDIKIEVISIYADDDVSILAFLKKYPNIIIHDIFTVSGGYTLFIVYSGKQ